MPGIASAATAVVIGARRRRHVDDPRRRRRHHAAQPRAAGDRRAVRHARVALSRAASTSASGRAPGTDQRTARALRRDLASDRGRRSRRTCSSCMRYFEPAQPGQAVRAVPGAGLDVPIWILGSSLFGAQLAAVLGLPFAFASHFAPARLMPALEIYREQLPAVGAARAALRDARRQRVRGRHRRRGAPPRRPRCSRRSSTCAAAGPSRCRRPCATIEGVLSRRRRARCSTRCWRARRSARRRPCARACTRSSRAPAPTS